MLLRSPVTWHQRCFQHELVLMCRSRVEVCMPLTDVWLGECLLGAFCTATDVAGMQGSDGLAQVAGREGRQRP